MRIDYQNLIDTAMHEVLRKALSEIAKQHPTFGDEDSFLISFMTNHPKTKISKKLKEQYPEEMMIVLQYQFDDLKILDNYFSVTLYFGGRPEVINVAYGSIISYIDKKANFALNFNAQHLNDGAAEENQSQDEASKVIFLDQFRK
jgi:hypothetical protein